MTVPEKFIYDPTPACDPFAELRDRLEAGESIAVVDTHGRVIGHARAGATTDHVDVEFRIPTIPTEETE